MHSRIVPIFSENTVILFIEIQLIHSEDNQKILGPPLFFNSTRFFIFHCRKKGPSFRREDSLRHVCTSV